MWMGGTSPTSPKPCSRAEWPASWCGWEEGGGGGAVAATEAEGGRGGEGDRGGGGGAATAAAALGGGSAMRAPARTRAGRAGVKITGARW